MASSRVRTVHAWAYLDLVATGLLALPGLGAAFVSFLTGLDASIRGIPAPEPLNALAMLFVNLAGILGVLWAIARLRTPAPELALLSRMDAFGRTFVGAVILYYVVFEGVPAILLAFVVTEFAGAVSQFRLDFSDS